MFASDDGKAVSIEKPWRVIRCKAGLASLRLRDLRHSHAAVAVSSGEGLRIVAGLLGHADIETTFGNAHLAEEAVFAAANRVSRTLADALDRKAPSNGWARPPDRCHRARGAAARNLLDRLSKTRSSEWVFPGTAREGHMSEGALYWFWCGVRDEADIVADARLHDLRHSHASHAIMNGESLHMAGRLLGHRRAAPTNPVRSSRRRNVERGCGACCRRNRGEASGSRPRRSGCSRATMTAASIEIGPTSSV